jgi:hypothetical protein
MRRSNWPEALAAIVKERRRMPMVWGGRANDCLSFAADVGVAMGCKDLLEGHREYTSAPDALRRLRDNGFEDLAAFCASRLPEIDVVHAQRGDIVLLAVDTPFRYAASIVIAGGLVIGPDTNGLMALPQSMGMKAFWVG